MPSATGTIRVESALSATESDALWALFCITFEPLRHRAAARHALSREEFDAELTAPSVIKLVGRDHHGRAVALATMSTDVAIFSWINADYYAERFGATPVFYVGVVLIEAAHRGSGLLSSLIDAMFERVHAVRGVLAFDLCEFNDRRLNLVEKGLIGARRLGPARSEILDTQTYHCIRFDADPDRES